jgi:hypothetical protein
MKTLLLALISVDKSRETREGAIRGLVGVGKEAITMGLVEGGGAKVVGRECMNGESSPLANSVLVRDSISLSCHCYIECTLGCLSSATSAFG